MRRANWAMALMAWSVAAVLGRAAAVADSGDWPQFRGGAALGKSAATVPLDWAADRNLAWRTPIPGSGWSQPVVAGGRIYVTTAVADNAKRPSGMSGGVMSLSTWGWGSAPSDPLEFRVLCLDPTDGRIVWSKTVADVKPTFGKHASNTFATETPCAAADGVYAFFGAIGTLVALNRDGNERWRRDLGPQPIQNQFGTGSSPVLHGGRLFIQRYNEEQGQLLCLDKRTGAELYRKRLPSGTSSIGSPLVIGDRIYLVNEKGKTVVVKAGPAFELLAESSLGDTDEIFWATPAVAGNSLYIRSSDALYCIREPQP